MATTCHVYLARLPSLLEGHVAWLDGLEVRRRAAFGLASARDRFTLGAALLRAAAAAHCGVDPASVAVDRTCEHCGAQHGRPRVDHDGLEASVSHSGDVVAVALSTSGPVGVDVEQVTSLKYGELLAWVCAPAEEALVTDAGDFFTYWTRKEAVLKATGEGLRRPMTEVRVAPPRERPALLALAHGPAPAPACRMADLRVGDGYVAAVAVLTTDAVDFAVNDGAGVLNPRRSLRWGHS